MRWATQRREKHDIYFFVFVFFFLSFGSYFDGVANEYLDKTGGAGREKSIQFIIQKQ